MVVFLLSYHFREFLGNRFKNSKNELLVSNTDLFYVKILLFLYLAAKKDILVQNFPAVAKRNSYAGNENR